MTSHPHPDAIADCVLDTFNALPAKFKPRQLADGRREWVPLAGIVLSRGMKCLPREKIPHVKGNVLHDWHAEVLCLRGFNSWLIDECTGLATAGRSGGHGEWLKWNLDSGEDGPPFSLHPDIQIHMYCSEAACGDASMELTMASQSDSTPWTSPPAPADEGLLGRGRFDQLGVVRRKPSRPDAPVCWSKSCSDKIALKQCVGLVSGLTSLLVGPCWLETLILPEGQSIPEAVERCFGRTGRMQSLVGWQGEGGLEFRPFVVRTTKREFAFSKAAAGFSPVSSNLSALCTPSGQEILINGVLQGRKQMDPKGASRASRMRLWEDVREVARRIDSSSLKDVLETERYAYVKDNEMLRRRREAKAVVKEKALKGWKRNDGDEEWGLSR